MIINYNTIVDRRDHVQYLTVSKSYSDNCTCSLTEQNTTLKNLYIMLKGKIYFALKPTGVVFIRLIIVKMPTIFGNLTNNEQDKFHA